MTKGRRHEFKGHVDHANRVPFKKEKEDIKTQQ